jgi:HSP20 family protein
MKNEELKIIDKKLPEKTQDRSPVPFFVEAEKLFDKFTAISQDIADKAFEFFRNRGGELGREMEDWFNAESKVLRFVPLEVTQQNGTVRVTAEVAGFKPEDIEISVHGKTLMISGETEKKDESTDHEIVYSDFESNRFFRQVELPCFVDAGNAKAEVNEGLLTVALPRAEEAKPKHISVSA